MKTLIINGSPRKCGETAMLTGILKEQIFGEIILIDAFSSNYSPCNDCRFCWTNDSCSIKDGATELLCDDFDNIVIASPIYFSQLTGPLLSLLSRLQYIWVSKAIRKDSTLTSLVRKGAYILVGGGEGSAEPATKMAKILLKQLGCDIIGGVQYLNTNFTHAIDDKTTVNQVVSLAKQLTIGGK